MRITRLAATTAVLAGMVVAAPTASAGGAATTRICAPGVCLTLDHDHQARISSLVVDGHEVLDPAQGIYSWLDTGAGTISSQHLDASPTVTVGHDTVVARFSTPAADETWTFRAVPDGVQFQLARTYTQAATLTQQGTPMMAFAQEAFDNMRWADGGDSPLAGPLVDTYQRSWLGAGKQFDPNVRASDEQISYTFLSASTRTALRVDGASNHAGVDRGSATEVRRTADPDGQDLRVAVETAAHGLQYVGPHPLGYGDRETSDGSPVFRPVAVAAGQQDVVTQTYRAADYGSYYDLGTLRGVDETQLSHAINDYARWMLGRTVKSALFPQEMMWFGQFMELFPEAGALRAFQKALADVRDWEQASSGAIECCRPGALSGMYSAYGDQSASYALAVVKAYQLSGDRQWLPSMVTSVERGLDWTIAHQTDPLTRLVKNHNPNLGPAGYDNDYWESSTGTYDGYSSALLYDALTQWAQLERSVLHNPTGADHFDGVAATLKASFNKDVADGGLWSPATHTYLYGSGNQDALYLPVNAAVLKSDLASPQRRRQVTEAIEAQDAAGNYDLHPMNVQDLYAPDTLAPTAGKGGENGAWYGAPDGDFYAGLPTLDDPQVLQTDIAGFLTRNQADGFYGASTWDRDNPLTPTASPTFFPTSVMPAWGLYHYGYGFQPGDDRLTLAPYVAPGMLGSSVNYTWRGTPLSVRYLTQSAYQLRSDEPLPTPVDVEWINQVPGRTVHVVLNGARTAVRASTDGIVSATLPAGTSGVHTAVCTDCVEPGQAGDHDATAAVAARHDGALRNDAYEQVGAQIAVGPDPITITSLSRYKHPGDHEPHRLKLLDANGHIVASATVDMVGQPDRDGFVHAPLTRPTTVRPGIYYLYSSETPGGDSWADDSTTVTSSRDITVLAAASGRVPVTSAGSGHSFGPVGLDYTDAGPATPWIQEFVEPSRITVRSGATAVVRATVWAQADRPVTGTITPTLPAGWTADPATFTVDTHGQPASSTVPVTLHVPADAATATHQITLAASAGSLGSSQTVTADVANILYDFDDGTTQGWQGDPPIPSVASVTSIANGPGTPFAGSHLLEFDTGTITGPDDPRVLHVEPATPLDLSNASTFYVHVDCWGIPPYTQTHQVTITLHSGSDSISSTTQFEANIWNRADIDVSSWAGRSRVTRIDVTYTLNEGAGKSIQVYADLDSVGFDA